MKSLEFKEQFRPLFEDKEWPCYITKTFTKKYICDGLPIEFIADDRMPEGYMLYFNYLDDSLTLINVEGD